jgi:hypothetical protein
VPLSARAFDKTCPPPPHSFHRLLPAGHWPVFQPACCPSLPRVDSPPRSAPSLSIRASILFIIRHSTGFVCLVVLHWLLRHDYTNSNSIVIDTRVLDHARTLHTSTTTARQGCIGATRPIRLLRLHRPNILRRTRDRLLLHLLLLHHLHQARPATRLPTAMLLDESESLIRSCRYLSLDLRANAHRTSLQRQLRSSFNLESP